MPNPTRVADSSLVIDPMNTSQISSTQRRIKARRAVIANDDDDEENDDIEIINEQLAKKDESKADMMDVSANKEHLEMMKKIEDLRQEHGDGWLQSQSASEVLDMMGLKTKSPSYSTLYMTKTPEQIIDEICDQTMPESIDHRTSTPIEDFDRTISPSAVCVSIEIHSTPFCLFKITKNIAFFLYSLSVSVATVVKNRFPEHQ